MTVKELISDLKYYDEDMEVLIQSAHSMYAEYIDSVNRSYLSAFRSEDRGVIVISGEFQAGAVD